MSSVLVKEKILDFLKFKDKERNLLLLSQIFNAIISVVVGKLIAVYFLPEEFGAFNIQMATYTFFFSLLLNPFLQYMKSITNTAVFNTGYVHFSKLALSLLVSTLLLIFITLKLYNDSSVKILALLALVLPLHFLYSLLLDYFNVKGKILSFSKMGMLNGLSGLGFLLFAIYFFKQSGTGLFLLWTMQGFCYLGGILFFIKKYSINTKSIPFDEFKVFFKNYSIYAWPLIVLAFWSWINSYFDRYLIEYFLNLKDVGIYNANLGLGSKVFLMLNPFFLTLLTPIAFNNEIGLKEKKQHIIKYAYAYIVVAFFILIILGFTYNFIGTLLLSKNYAEGNYVIFWTALAYFLVTFTYLFEVIFYFQKRTGIILLSNVISAITAIALNLIFIPIFGLQGALIGLVASGLIRFLVVWFVFKKL
ncbi:MAG: polysaccharide biosynthesis C-terminal domain-containing protein [Bacteroidota bacterium]